MKNILLFSLFALFLSGCFKDEGNYAYREMIEPLWLFDAENTNIDIYCRQGEMAVFRASHLFSWPEDSLDRSQEVRYEWRYKDILISEELDFEMPTNDLIELLNLNVLADKGLMGTFRIIEKESDITFMCRFYLTINPYISTYDWLVLSEDGNDSKYTAVARRRDGVTGEVKYELMEPVANGSAENYVTVPGRPKNAAMSLSRNIGPLGASTVITDQGAYVFDNATLKKHSEIKDEFLDGIPGNFQVAARRDIDGQSFGVGHYTFIASTDGKIYTRQMSENWLGGKFLTEPYEIDEKGYFITKFGHTLFDYPNIPCIDEKNQRIIIANVWRVDVPGESGEMGDETSVYKSRLVEPKRAGGDYEVPVYDLRDKEVLHLTQASHFYMLGGTTSGYSLIFNRDGKSYVYDFAIDNRTLSYVGDVECYLRSGYGECPVVFDESTIFLTSCNPNKNMSGVKKIVYSNGRQVRYLQRPEYMDLITGTSPYLTDHPLLEVDAKVTSLSYDWWDLSVLVVGCENGDVYFYDMTYYDRPGLIGKVNVGGKVVALRMLGTANSTKDLY